jgi:hypothetical protein
MATDVVPYIHLTKHSDTEQQLHGTIFGYQLSIPFTSYQCPVRSYEKPDISDHPDSQLDHAVDIVVSSLSLLSRRLIWV